MKKLESLFCHLLPLFVLVGLRIGYCVLFGTGTTPTPNLEHSFYQYQPPINDNRPLSIGHLGLDPSTIKSDSTLLAVPGRSVEAGRTGQSSVQIQ